MRYPYGPTSADLEEYPLFVKTVSAVVLAGSLLMAPSALASDPGETPAGDSAATATPAGVCADEPPMETPFLGWGDPGNYLLAPGGDFENGGEGWALSGGATLESGSSPEGWGTSLNLPEDATALSPPICVADGYTHGRMFGQAVGDDRRPKARVEVEVLYSSGEDDSDDVRVNADWDATGRVRFDVDEYVLDPVTGTDTIQLLLSGEGKSNALLDQVYIDPTHRH